MSKKAVKTADDRRVIEAAQAAHRALGWVQVVLPGGHRRMMTAAGFEAWKAGRHE